LSLTKVAGIDQYRNLSATDYCEKDFIWWNAETVNIKNKMAPLALYKPVSTFSDW